MNDAAITVESKIFYIILSITIFLFSILSTKVKNKQKKYVVLFIVIILSSVAGFRAYSVGRDTYQYVIDLNIISNGGSFARDPGYGLLCKVLLTIWNNPTFVFLVFAVLTNALIYYRFWELKDKCSFPIMAFAYYSFYFFESMNAMRQFCAVAIVFWGTRYLQKKKYIPFIVCVMIASLFFHRSALLSIAYLGIELFSWKDLSKQQKRLLITLIFWGIIFSGIIISFLGYYTSYYEHYFRNINTNIGLRVFALMAILVVSLFLYHRHDRRQKHEVLSNEQNELYVLRNVRIYYAVSCGLGSIGYFYDYMGRIGYYFALFQFVYFGILAKEDNRLCRCLFKIMIWFIIMYVLYNYIFVVNGAYQHPYHFIWNS